MPAECAAVRERLAEHALGVLSDGDRRDVDRHLERCAACRKEAGELSGAATTLAFALEPAPVPEGLLARVLGVVGRAARSPVVRRRTRATAVVALAATIALAAMSFGAVMAGRSQRYEVLARAEAQQQLDALRRFQKLFGKFQGELGTGLRTDQTRLFRLIPTTNGAGGGAALELVSDDLLDFVMLHVSGLSNDPSSLPYTVWLVDASGRSIRAGRLSTLDASHGGEVFHEFDDTDLAPYTTIVVRDATGVVALRGEVDAAAP
jgi:hypothetical protein